MIDPAGVIIELIVHTPLGELVTITYGTYESHWFTESFGQLKVAGEHPLRRKLNPPSGDWGPFSFGGIRAWTIVQKHPCCQEVTSVAFNLFGDRVPVLDIIVCKGIVDKVCHVRQRGTLVFESRQGLRFL